jgi:hypothetical protein
MLVSINKIRKLPATMQTERFLHLIDIRAHLREIESHDEKLVMYRRRMLPDIQMAEQFVELVSVTDIIVRLQHRQREAFPEASGRMRKR